MHPVDPANNFQIPRYSWSMVQRKFAAMFTPLCSPEPKTLNVSLANWRKGEQHPPIAAIAAEANSWAVSNFRLLATYMLLLTNITYANEQVAVWTFECVLLMGRKSERRVHEHHGQYRNSHKPVQASRHRL